MRLWVRNPNESQSSCMSGCGLVVPNLEATDQLQYTYRRGNSCCIDFMLGTQCVQTCIQCSRALEYNDEIVSDHRGLYVAGSGFCWLFYLVETLMIQLLCVFMDSPHSKNAKKSKASAYMRIIFNTPASLYQTLQNIQQPIAKSNLKPISDAISHRNVLSILVTFKCPHK